MNKIKSREKIIKIIKIGGVNAQGVRKINKRILQDIERLRGVEENTTQKVCILSNTYFKI